MAIGPGGSMRGPLRRGLASPSTGSKHDRHCRPTDIACPSVVEPDLFQGTKFDWRGEMESPAVGYQIASVRTRGGPARKRVYVIRPGSTYLVVVLSEQRPREK
jgi:hypothetical protein